MQKTAQKRSLLNKLKEMTNVSGIATEKVFSPEFKELMERLRDETDDPVRAIVTGEQIGNASPPSDGISMKDLLKSAKSNLNRREYMRAVSDLGRFHKKMNDVVRILSSFKSETDKIHEKFLFEGMDEEHKQHLHDLKSRFASQHNSLVKEASILDFLTNIGTERGRALSGWEKRYPKEIGRLKASANSLLAQSERMLTVTISVLKELAKSRSVRNPDKYIQDSSKITKEYEKYDRFFKEFYNTNVKGFLEKQELVSPVKTDNSDKSKELGNQELTDTPVVPTVPAGPIPEALMQHPISPAYVPGSTVGPESIKNIIPVDKSVPSSGDDRTILAPPPEHISSPAPALIPSPPPLPKMTPEEMKQFEMEHSVAHHEFYQSLETLSHTNPQLMARYIGKYAKSIQSTDLKTAVKLFKLAKSIGE